MVGSIPFFQNRKDAVRVGGLVSIEELNSRGKERDAKDPKERPAATSGTNKKVLPLQLPFGSSVDPSA
jgi:hypothetical protein